MKRTSLPLLTGLSVAAIGIGYIQQMAPSPILHILRAAYSLEGSDALLNLCVSIIYPMTIAASLWGSRLESRIGICRLFTWALCFLTLGVGMNLIAGSYLLFLTGRVLFSVGFGLAIPYIGSAIMNWYGPRGRDRMNTLNGMFPFLGTVISFSTLLPLTERLGSFRLALGLWGAALAVLLALWLLLVRGEDGASPPEERGMYRALWRIRDIRLLCAVFVLDFFCYSYLVVVLPAFFAEAGGMEPVRAGQWAALAFPAMGILGTLLGGWLMARLRRRKAVLSAGQLVKLAGMLTLTLGIGSSLWLGVAGAVLFGLGNGMWMPALYAMPMDMPDMTPSRVGAAFALISSCGFAVGFVSPVLGGWLTDLLAASGAGGHAFGLKWSLFLFGFTNLVSFAASLLLREPPVHTVSEAEKGP